MAQNDPFGSVDFDLNVTTDLSGITGQDVDNLGKGVPPGMYHCILEKVEKTDADKDKPYLKLHFLIMEGTVDAKGLKFTENLYYGSPEKLKDVLKRYTYFGDKLGLPMRAALNTGSVTFDWRQAQGRQCVVQIQENKYQDKSGVWKTNSKVAYTGIWPVASPDVMNVPKEKQLLERDKLGHLYSPELWVRATSATQRPDTGGPSNGAAGAAVPNGHPPTGHGGQAAGSIPGMANPFGNVM